MTKYVEREILNHRFLMHPHIVQFKEVSTTSALSLLSTAGVNEDTLLDPSQVVCCASLLQSHSHMSDKMSWHVQVFLTSRYLAIAMEYVAGGDMFEYVVRKGGLKESEARWFFQQLIIGVDYLHRMVLSCPSPALLSISQECWDITAQPAKRHVRRHRHGTIKQLAAGLNGAALST